MDHNKVTIETYENECNTYLEKTGDIIKEEFKSWIQEALSQIHTSGRILEIGTGGGRDADYIESLGYQIQRSDLPDTFIQYNKDQGKDIIKLNILDLPLEEKYDLIFANKVLCHFQKDELASLLQKMNDTLNQEGVLAFSLKRGSGEGFTKGSTVALNSGRFYSRREIDEIKNLLKSLGFPILYITEQNAGSKNICIICKKK